MIRLTNLAPDPHAFVALRAACGWGTIPVETARRALATSTAMVTGHHGDTLVAVGRVVGDGALYFYLQDIIVAPEFRRQGIGRTIVDRLLFEIAPLAAPGATIGLMAAKGAEDLYISAGFTPRPTNQLGPGMTRFVE